MEIKFTLNGEVIVVEVPPHWTLLRLLREKLGLTGTKEGCGIGECGSCTVLLDGEPVLSCLTLAIGLDGSDIVTAEGLLQPDGSLHPVQESFLEHGAVQCGFCTPGMILMGKALLDENPKPTEDEIREYIRGNLCRCTGYTQIVKAIKDTSKNKHAKS